MCIATRTGLSESTPSISLWPLIERGAILRTILIINQISEESKLRSEI